MSKIEKKNKNYKYIKLILSIVFDAIGMLSFTIPIIGESTDIIWAPISVFLMTMMYKGYTGKIAGLVSFAEELLPGFDIMPTFTLTWLYQYVLKSKNNKDKIIDVSEQN